jgi:hypothetical protein
MECNNLSYNNAFMPRQVARLALFQRDAHNGHRIGIKCEYL